MLTDAELDRNFDSLVELNESRQSTDATLTERLLMAIYSELVAARWREFEEQERKKLAAHEPGLIETVLDRFSKD